MRYLEEENGAMMKTFKDAVTGFATGKTSLVLKETLLFQDSSER